MRIDPLGDRTTFTYDAGSLLLEKKDRNDRLCSYAYDALGRLASETWKDAGGTIVNALTYTYDLNSNLLTADDDNGTYTFTYDALDRVATQKDIWAKTLTFTYDAADNRTLVEDSEAGITTSVFDADNRLTSRRFDDGTAELRIDFTYTSRDQVATATRYSDVAGTTQVGSSVYTYDDSVRLTNLQHKNAAGSTLANYTYTYDVADRLTSETRNGTAVTYTYDATNQLLTDGSGGGGPYNYDLNGNRTAYTTGADNRLLSDGVYTYTYDDEGNRTRRELLAGGDIWVYAYDHRNRLVLAQHQDTDESAVDAEYTFQYDVFGNRIEVSQDDDGAGEGSAVVTRFAYDGLHIWADLDSGSSLTSRRIFGDQVDEVLVRVEGSTVSWYLQDRLGSVREIANNTTGAFIYEVTFDGFGNVISESGSAGDRYLFAGREWFDGLGLYDDRTRPYGPDIGRFWTEDRIGLAAGPNTYAYVHNSPTNFTDPLGLNALSAQERNARAEQARDLLRQVNQAAEHNRGETNRISTDHDRDVLNGILTRLQEDPNLTEAQYQRALDDLQTMVWRGPRGNRQGTSLPWLPRGHDANGPRREGVHNPLLGNTQDSTIRRQYIDAANRAMESLRSPDAAPTRDSLLTGGRLRQLQDLKRRLEEKPVLEEKDLNDLRELDGFLAREAAEQRQADALQAAVARANFVGPVMPPQIPPVIRDAGPIPPEALGQMWRQQQLQAERLEELRRRAFINRLANQMMAGAMPIDWDVISQADEIDRAERAERWASMTFDNQMRSRLGLFILFALATEGMGTMSSLPGMTAADTIAARTMTRLEWQEFHRAIRNEARLAAEANWSLPSAIRSPVNTGLIDARTGQTFGGNNTLGLSDSLHPLARERLMELHATTDLAALRARAGDLGRWVHSTPGAHAEVNAFNQALWAREAAGLPIDVGEFWMVNRWASRHMPPAPRCGYCRQLTRGVNTLTD